MTDYLYTLSPWERRKEYYAAIQLTEDVARLTEAISLQTGTRARQQLSAASEIVAGQASINEAVNLLALDVGEVARGVEGLQACFEWGISTLVWQIEQSRAELRSILQLLQAPLDTQAKERRRRAEEALANGWIDDAEEEFIESEKLNRFDFSIHMSLGMIYLFHKPDKEKAFAYFEKAAKYAKPKSSYHRSIALLHGALCRWDAGNLEDAHRMSAEAVETTPSLAEAQYQFAGYCAQKGEVDECMKHLECAIRSDPGYCLKADSDRMFSPVVDRVHALIAQLTCEIVNAAQESIELQSLFVEEINLVIGPLRCNSSNSSHREFTAECNRVSRLLELGSFFSALQGLAGAEELSARADLYRSEQLRLAQNHHEMLEKEIAVSEMSRRTSGHVAGVLIGIIGLALGVPVGLRSCNALRDVALETDMHGMLVFFLFLAIPAVFLTAVAIFTAGGFGVGTLLGTSQLMKSSKKLKTIRKTIASVSRRIEKLEKLQPR